MRVVVLTLAVITTGGLGLMDGAPPVKMGLWEKTEVTTVTAPAGMEARMKQAGAVSGVPKTTRSKACYTAEVWERTLGIPSASEDCTVSKRSVSAKGADVSLSCTFRDIVMKTDATYAFDSPEAWHGEAHNSTVYPANMMGAGGGTVTSVNTFKATYAGPTCGDVPAGKVVIEK